MLLGQVPRMRLKTKRDQVYFYLFIYLFITDHSRNAPLHYGCGNALIDKNGSVFTAECAALRRHVLCRLGVTQ